MVASAGLTDSCPVGIGVVDTVDQDNTTTAAGAALVAFIAIFNAAAAVGPGVAG